MENFETKIYQSVMKFLLPLTPEQTYSLVVCEAINLIQAEGGSLLLEENGKLKKGYSSNLSSSNTGATVNTPILYNNTQIGILALTSQKTSFSKEDIRKVKLFASLSSLFIKKAQLYSEVKKAKESRDLFISMASHEMRTPLTTISGYIQMLHSKFSGIDTPESRWVDQLSRESLRLVNLVSEFLQIEKIKTGKLEYMWSECSVIRVIDQAKMAFCFSHPDCNITFENKLKNHPDLVVGDFDKLVQVVTNLLDNAAQSSAAPAPVTIELLFRSPNIVLKIQDQGRGIAKKDLPQIFNRFFRGSNSSGEGMGLGLFFAGSIIKKHRGKISIRSRQGKGTLVEVKLPQMKRKNIN